MAEAKNEHYQKVVERLSEGKDSIFEIGEVTKFDPKTLTLSVLGLRTKEVKENVIMTFPNLFMNSGQIHFPLNKTKGLLFVGPDNQNFFLPAQFHLPYMDSDNQSGKASLDASPERLDPIINFSDFEQGEMLTRHISGSQMTFRNNGAIELVTNKGHMFLLDSMTGELKEVSESTNRTVGYSNVINEVIQPRNSKEKAIHTIRGEFYSNGPEWKSSTPITLEDALAALKNEPDLDVGIKENLLKFQLINVLDDNGEQVNSITSQKKLIADVNLSLKNGLLDLEVDEDGRIESTYRDANERVLKRKIESRHSETIELKDANGNSLNVSVKANGFEIKQMGGVNNKTIEMNNNGMKVKYGTTVLNVTNNDIEFVSSKGKTSINEIISWMER